MMPDAAREQWDASLRTAAFFAYALRQYGYSHTPTPATRRQFELTRAYAQGLARILAAVDAGQQAPALDAVLADVDPAYRSEAADRLKNTATLILTQLSA